MDSFQPLTKQHPTEASTGAVASTATVKRSLHTRRQQAALMVSLSFYTLVTTLSLYWLYSGWAFDDPFITYRYANNLTNGLGFVYNHGEQVLSTTTPLFTLILAALGWLWTDTHQLAILTGAFCLAIGGICLWDLGRFLKSASSKAPSMIGWSGLLLYPTFPLVAITLGSEMPVYLALCLAAFTFYARRRYRLTALLVGLATLTRPDGILLALLFASDYLFQADYLSRVSKTTSARRAVTATKPETSSLLARLQPPIIYLAITLGWGMFAWLYFGSPYPATLAAKQQQAMVTGSEGFYAGFVTILGWYNAFPYKLEAALAMLGTIYMMLQPRLRMPTSPWLLYFAWALLYFIAYSVIGVTRYFWYYAPLVPWFVIAIGLVLDLLSHISLKPWLIRTREPSSSQKDTSGEQSLEILSNGNAPSPRLSAFRILATTILFFALLSQAFSLVQGIQNPDTRYQIYRAAGSWLAANTPPGASVGSLEVGIIGYFAGRPMVDFAGLIQPEVAARLGELKSYDATAVWAVERYHPDYLVIHTASLPALLYGYVAQYCQLATEFRGADYGFSQNLAIYSCPR